MRVTTVSNSFISELLKADDVCLLSTISVKVVLF